MKALVIYDSAFGNTQKIAEAVASELQAPAVKINDAKVEDLEAVELLLVGSPTQGGKPTQPVQDFIAQIPADGLKNKKMAAFDTRIQAKDQNIGLRLVMKTIGYAAGKIESGLKAKGGEPAGEAGLFIVTDKEGPLADGELERAQAWAKQLTA